MPNWVHLKKPCRGCKHIAQGSALGMKDSRNYAL